MGREPHATTQTDISIPSGEVYACALRECMCVDVKEESTER